MDKPIGVPVDVRLPAAEVRERLYKTIDDKHTTLFLDWDVSKPHRREDCVDYLMNLLEELGLVWSVPQAHAGEIRFVPWKGERARLLRDTDNKTWLWPGEGDIG